MSDVNEQKLELYAEEIPEITEFTGVTPISASTMSTESTLLCATGCASTYTTMSSASW